MTSYEQKVIEFGERLRPFLERLRGEKLSDEEVFKIAQNTMQAGSTLIKRKLDDAMRERFSKPPNLLPPGYDN
jgi:hypothetical protein